MIPSIDFPLDAMPELVQCGLCVHGVRAVETFCQQGLWSLHVYHYAGELSFRRRTHEFRPGWASLLPPDEEITWKFPSHAPHFYAHFRVRARNTRMHSVPVLQAMGSRQECFDRDVGEMVRFFPGDGSRAHVRLWDLLHRYAVSPEPENPAGGMHPAVQIAISIIRNSPSERLRVAGIARRMGVSHNQLTLLFQKQFGCGVLSYMRQERIALACDKLRMSRLPVKSIAIECGFPDLQYFNKVIRRATGQSPTALRGC